MFNALAHLSKECSNDILKMNRKQKLFFFPKLKSWPRFVPCLWERLRAQQHWRGVQRRGLLRTRRWNSSEPRGRPFFSQWINQLIEESLQAYYLTIVGFIERFVFWRNVLVEEWSIWWYDHNLTQTRETDEMILLWERCSSHLHWIQINRRVKYSQVHFFLALVRLYLLFAWYQIPQLDIRDDAPHQCGWFLDIFHRGCGHFQSTLFVDFCCYKLQWYVLSKMLNVFAWMLT